MGFRRFHCEGNFTDAGSEASLVVSLHTCLVLPQCKQHASANGAGSSASQGLLISCKDVTAKLTAMDSKFESQSAFYTNTPVILKHGQILEQLIFNSPMDL